MHNSVPFAMEGIGEALLDLKPERPGPPHPSFRKNRKRRGGLFGPAPRNRHEVCYIRCVTHSNFRILLCVSLRALLQYCSLLPQ